MAEISRSAAKAFMRGTPFRCRNTVVQVEQGMVIMRLHGHAIARRVGQRIEMRTAGFPSQTTVSRLNHVMREMLGTCVYRKKQSVLAAIHVSSKEPMELVHLGPEFVVVHPGSPLEQLATVEVECQ